MDFNPARTKIDSNTPAWRIILNEDGELLIPFCLENPLPAADLAASLGQSGVDYDALNRGFFAVFNNGESVKEFDLIHETAFYEKAGFTDYIDEHLCGGYVGVSTKGELQALINAIEAFDGGFDGSAEDHKGTIKDSEFVCNPWVRLPVSA
ncbi:hypothetical protein D0962_09595 [Leptolyngbyaceae cyanobacterium CCMR0082]|uniref:Uncharacterized protein n=1 Tax=Adonisia turfae CCMR0082 TaxID=2304604 RepID=A0A6M0S4Z7_9CYAN|nr:hypothetical protein [Adonisia turfae]NEZ63031.1 hypothetical protein [Adonisia turfae CCMR0082]